MGAMGAHDSAGPEPDGGGAGAAGTAGLSLDVRGLGLRGPRGWAYRSVRVTAGPGSLVAVAGPSGSGRTSLLLTLTGRMRPTEGTALVGGLVLPRRMAAVRRVSALAHVPGVTDLDPALTVAEHLRERALLQRRFGDSVRGCCGRAGNARVRRGRRSTVPWTPPGWTRSHCPRARGPPYGTWSGWSGCGCRSRWR